MMKFTMLQFGSHFQTLQINTKYLYSLQLGLLKIFWKNEVDVNMYWKDDMVAGED